MYDDDIDIDMAEYTERRGLLDTIYSEPKKGKMGMIMGAPWTKSVEYLYRTFVITAIIFGLFMCALAMGCT